MLPAIFTQNKYLAHEIGVEYKNEETGIAICILIAEGYQMILVCKNINVKQITFWLVRFRKIVPNARLPGKLCQGRKATFVKFKLEVSLMTKAFANVSEL